MLPATSAKFALREAGPGRLVLSCQGGLSWEDRDVLAGHVADALRNQTPLAGIVVDLAEVGFVNSAGIGALFQVRQQLRQRGGQLIFANVPPALQRLFRAIGMNHVAELVPDVATGLAHLEAPEPGAGCIAPPGPARRHRGENATC